MPAPQPKLAEFNAPVVPSANQPPISLPQLEFTPVPKILQHFINRTRADLVLFADRNGVPMAHCKKPALELPPPNHLEMIAKLAAGQMAAAREIGRSIGKDQDFTLSLSGRRAAKSLHL